MDWNISGDRPVYLQLIEQMERAIVAGEYGAGARLPGVRELAAEAAVNPNTMQRALQELEARGLVNTQRTAGRTVTEDAARIAQLRRQLALQQANSFLSAMRALGYEKPETLALLEGLQAPCTDAADINANAAQIWADPSDGSANKPDTAANAAQTFADSPDTFARKPETHADAAGISANTPNNPTHSTGRN